MIAWPLCAAEPPVSAQFSAILQEGTARKGGLEGFGPNNIDSLYGRYESDSLGAVRVQATRERVLFNPSLWTQITARGLGAAYVARPAGATVYAVRRQIRLRDSGESAVDWTLLAAFSPAVAETDALYFLEVFAERTAVFFSAARRSEDLSFPATLVGAGK